MQREQESLSRAGTESGEVEIDVVVPAGSINRISLFPGCVAGPKALVAMRGRPLIDYVLEALYGARSVGRILVIGPPEVVAVAQRWPNVIGASEETSLVGNVWRGLALSQTERVLFCNPDQPLLRSEMVDEFVEQARLLDADLVSSWVRGEGLALEPEHRHKFAQFGDGLFAHGNLFMVRKAISNPPLVRKRLDALYRARKSELRFFWALGPVLFLRFLLARTLNHLPTLDETLRICGEHFGLRLVSVIGSYPEIAFDIDEPEDFAAAERLLARRAEADRSAA